MNTELLTYNLGEGVEAFSTRRDSVLPYDTERTSESCLPNGQRLERHAAYGGSNFPDMARGARHIKQLPLRKNQMI